MGKKKIFIITIALLLVVGTGSFVFAGEGDQELDVDNRPNSGQQITPVPKDDPAETPVPVIKPPVTEEPNETPNENDNTSTNNTTNSSASRPGASGNGSSSTTKPTAPSNKPDVEQPTTPSNPNDNNGSTGSENKPQEPNKPTSTLKVVSIESSNKNKFTFDPVSVTIKFNEPIKGVNEDGWTSRDNDLTRIKVNITKNGTYKIIAYDKNEIALEITYEVKNYHPMPDITTSIDENGTTKITMKPEEDLGDIEGWTKEDDGTYTKIIGENEDLTDLNIGGEEIKIDYTKPELETKVSNINEETGKAIPSNEVTITITSKTGEKLILPDEDGWVLSEDGLSISKKFEKNVPNGKITIADIKGNQISMNYKVEYVYKGTPKIYDLDGIVLSDREMILMFHTGVKLKFAPNGWDIDMGMKDLNILLDDCSNTPKVLNIVLHDIYGNTAYYTIKASIVDGNAVVTYEEIKSQEIINKLKLEYNLN